MKSKHCQTQVSYVKDMKAKQKKNNVSDASKMAKLEKEVKLLRRQQKNTANDLRAKLRPTQRQEQPQQNFVWPTPSVSPWVIIIRGGSGSTFFTQVLSTRAGRGSIFGFGSVTVFNFLFSH